MKKGIDISEHNGNINMEKVKKSGIQFIILRFGYGKNSNQIDKKFKINYENAINNNIPIGLYHYSYATNIEDAQKEAAQILEIYSKTVSKIKIRAIDKLKKYFKEDFENEK